MNRYHINIFYSKADKAFVADVPDLETCSAFGKTPQDALKEVLEAMQLWLDTAKDIGKQIPRPNYKPPLYQGMIGEPVRGTIRRSKSPASRRRKTARAA
jgi:predicted RNase H-like HicB family nuclease